MGSRKFGRKVRVVKFRAAAHRIFSSWYSAASSYSQSWARSFTRSSFTFGMEHRIEVVAGGVLVVGALVGLGYLLSRLGLLNEQSEPAFYDADQVKQRVMGAAFRLEVQLYAMYEEADAEREVAERALQPVVASYRRFDNPMGGRFETGPVEKIDGLDPARADLGFVGVRRDILGRVTIGEGVVGTREAAALWHTPGDAVNAPSLLRAGSRRLPVPSEMFVLEDGLRGEAAIVGLEKYGDGGLRKIHFPAATWRSSFLIVASSGMGKSTLTGHLVPQSAARHRRWHQ